MTNPVEGGCNYHAWEDSIPNKKNYSVTLEKLKFPEFNFNLIEDIP